jgi:protein TonB
MQNNGSQIPSFNLPKFRYQRRFELGLIFSLALMLLLFFFLRDASMPITVREHEPIILTVENIPQTRQQLGARRPPPPKPAIPIPVESELIPEDETIEPTTVDVQAVGTAASAGTVEGLGGAGQIIPPRPIAFVVPEYPEEDRKKNIRGEVKVSLEIDASGKVVKAVVIENTTGSPRCAQAALRAALASRFTPARNAQGPVPYWLIQPYKFDLKT